MGTTLPLYWNLSSANKAERLDASVKLITSLEQFQVHHLQNAASSSESEGDEENVQNVTDATFEKLNSEDVRYALKRLVRGLASPRESSRLGFAVALTELLSRLNTFTSSYVISLVLESSVTQGNVKGQEERDFMFARLFGLTSVVQSRLLLRQGTLPRSRSPISTLQDFQTTVSELFRLGSKKSWLSDSCWWTVILAMESLYSSQISWKDDATKWTLDLIYKPSLPVGETTPLLIANEWSPEKLAFTLRVQTLFPEEKWTDLLSPTFKNGSLLSVGSLSTVARILRDNSFSDEEDANVPQKSSGTWKPRLHYAWDIILSNYFPSSESLFPPPPPTNSSFRDFFRIVVDESLFASTSSPERKSWGFQVFEMALHKVPSDEIPLLFTKNFMRSWINHLSRMDRYLHNAARKVASEIHQFVQQNPPLGLTLVLQLLGKHGHQQFDKITKTKTVETILTSMTSDGISEYITYLESQIYEDDRDSSDTSSVDAKRLWVIDQFSALIRNGAIPKVDKWRMSIIEFFVVHGYFTVIKKREKSSSQNLRANPPTPISEKVRDVCRTRLFTCLGELTGQVTLLKSGSGKTSKASGRTSDGPFWLAKATELLATLEKDSKHVALVLEQSEDSVRLRKEVLRVLKKLKTVPEERKETAEGAELLLQSLVLQSYSEDVTDDLQESLNSAQTMFGLLAADLSDSEEKPQLPIDVLVDVIIAYLEQSSVYARTVANQVFGLMTSEVRDSTVDLILSQLEKRNVGDDDVDDDEEDEDDVDEEESGDARSEDERMADASELDHGEADQEEGSDSEEDAPDDEELRQKIAEVFKVNGTAVGEGEDDESSDDEVMDDDQMMKLDEHLAEVFRSQAPTKTKNDRQGAEREATYFKIRILDLLDLYAKKQPHSSQILRFIMPLIQLVRSTGPSEEQLSSKATSILQRIGKSKESPSDVEATYASDVLQHVHELARKAPNVALVTTLSQCSLYVTRAVLHADQDSTVTEQYEASLVDYLTRKASGLHTNFFLDFIRRHPSCAWGLRYRLASLCTTTESVNAYRQLQAFHLLQVLLEQALQVVTPVEIAPFLRSSSRVIYDTLLTACEDSARALSATQLKDLFKVAFYFLRSTKQLQSKHGIPMSDDKGGLIWKSEAIRQLSDAFAQSDRFKSSASVQSQCQQLLTLVETDGLQKGDEKKNGEGKKRKAGEVPDIVQERGKGLRRKNKDGSHGIPTED